MCGNISERKEHLNEIHSILKSNCSIRLLRKIIQGQLKIQFQSDTHDRYF